MRHQSALAEPSTYFRDRELHARVSGDVCVRRPLDSLSGVRCPACGHELIARMTGAGPGFPCACREK